MKKILAIISMFIICTSMYSQTVVSCPQCYGYGTIMTYAGPMYCPTCCGSGRVVVNLPQNTTSSERGEVSFQGKSHGDAPAPTGYVYQGRSIKFNGRYYKVYARDGKLYIFDKVDGRYRIE
jgi:DnaJ-class molecular chaperone